MVALPNTVGYGTVQWTVAELVVDSALDPDQLPELISGRGQVTFTPSISRVKVLSPALTLLLRPIVARLYSDGTLRDPQGNVGVTLLSTASTGLDVAANSWSWTATFEVENASIPAFTFPLAKNQVIDLTPAVSSVSFADGLSAINVVYTYNLDGTVSTASDGHTLQTYVYQSGQLTKVIWTYVS